MISRRLLSRILILTGLAVVLGALPALAQPTIKRETARRAQSLEGDVTYRTYCAVCHGTDGKGNGPAAAALKTAPADLTTYAQRHGGQFSAVELREVIEGERPIAAHGTREMPIWGDVFRSLYDRPQTDLLIRNLLNYVESLQVK